MDWKSYEETVKNIYETLGKNNGVTIKGYGNGCKQKGKSQVEHQIDVLTSHSDGIHEYLTAVECKYWQEKVTKDTVMKLENIVTDCGFNKGVIVSKLGFTPDAITYARFVNIELVELREPIESDWDGKVKDISIEMHVKIPNLIEYKNISSKNVVDSQTGPKTLISTTEYFYEYPDRSVYTIKHFVDEFLNTKLTTLNVEVQQQVDFPIGTVMKSKSSVDTYPVTGIKMTGKLTEFIQNVEIRGEQYVSMIMKTVFSGKEFVVKKTGEIREITKLQD